MMNDNDHVQWARTQLVPAWTEAVDRMHHDPRAYDVLERQLQQMVAQLAHRTSELGAPSKRLNALLVLKCPHHLPAVLQSLFDRSLGLLAKSVRQQQQALNEDDEDDEDDEDEDDDDDEEEECDDHDNGDSSKGQLSVDINNGTSAMEQPVNLHKRQKPLPEQELASIAMIVRMLRELRLGEIIERVAMDTINVKLGTTVKTACDRGFDKPALRAIQGWLHTTIMPWLERLQVFSAGQTTAVQEQLTKKMYQTLARERIDQLFDIIVDYEGSKDARQDLKVAMEKANMRPYLISSLKATLRRRLLHPGASTPDILLQYINTIRTLQQLDPSGICLEQVGEPVRAYLRGRDDAIRCIITSLTGDEELAEELQGPGGTASTGLIDDGTQDLSDYESDHWEPDPVEADLSKSSASRRSADIISKLVSIYGSRDVFVREYQNLLADRLVVLTNYDTDKEVRSLELLKLRFGDAALHMCEVMLKDIADSKRTDNAVHELAGKDKVDLPMHSQILSRLYWPGLRREDVTFPNAMKAVSDVYEQKYSTHKPQRKLEWMATLGTVSLSLTFQDRTLDFSVPPIQAAIVSAFDSRESATLNELANELGMNPTALQRRISFWVQQGVLHEEPQGTFRVAERVEPDQKGPPGTRPMAADDVDEEESGDMMAVASSDDSAADTAAERLYWLMIYNMIRNLGSLSTDRIHSTLGIFVQAPNQYEWTPVQLEAFLGKLVNEGKLSV